MGTFSERPDAFYRLTFLVELDNVLVWVCDLAYEKWQEMLFIELICGSERIKKALLVSFVIPIYSQDVCVRLTKRVVFKVLKVAVQVHLYEVYKGQWISVTLFRP